MVLKVCCWRRFLLICNFIHIELRLHVLVTLIRSSRVVESHESSSRMIHNESNLWSELTILGIGYRLIRSDGGETITSVGLGNSGHVTLKQRLQVDLRRSRKRLRFKTRDHRSWMKVYGSWLELSNECVIQIYWTYVQAEMFIVMMDHKVWEIIRLRWIDTILMVIISTTLVWRGWRRLSFHDSMGVWSKNPLYIKREVLQHFM